MTDNRENKNDYRQLPIICRSSRAFSLRLIKFFNGCFISISEDNQKIGSLHVSTAHASKVSTAKVIPSKVDSIFLTSISERIALMLNGFAIVNFSASRALNKLDMEDILSEILKLIE
jgi:hypothetical protein